ncbi:hypothetical protein [Ruania zhangjianzhongii]|uniref:hypothetical protein n=1 Tax=Ruania zhangjianzhongii TaxID=2603206 RepID=UPI0011C7E06E|nr:hypothetical protein [Ruania zhangjianzhongii]
MTGDAGGPSLDLTRSRHLLAVADDVSAEEVEALVLSRYPDAIRTEPDVLTLAGGVHLSGPFPLDGAGHRDLGLPAWADGTYLLTCPQDRGRPVPAELAATGGLLGAFAAGEVRGRERETLELLLAMGRRLGAVVRTSTGHVLEPEEWAGVDLTVYAPVWLYPDALVHVLTPVLPGVQALTDVQLPDAPLPPATGRPGGGADLDDGERAWLHAEADAYDAHTLAQPEVLESYGTIWHYPSGGVITASVAAADVAPVVLAGLDRVGEGMLSYELRWYPADPQQWDREPPPTALRTECADARERIEAAARAVLTAVGGQATDDDGFLVQP